MSDDPGQPTPDALSPMLRRTRRLRTRLVHSVLTLDERLAVAAVLATATATVDAARDHDKVGRTNVGELAVSVDQLAALCATPVGDEGWAER